MEETKDKKLKEKIKELKKTEKGKAIWKLIKWGIFFGCLFLFMILSALINALVPKRENEIPPKDVDVVVDEKVEEVLTKEILKRKLEELKMDNYSYEYQITKGEERFLFQGKKIDNYREGYKEYGNGIIKYYIDETGIYQETMNDKVLIDNLYEGIENGFWDFDYLFSLVENLTYVKNNNHNCMYPLYEMQDEVNKYSFHFTNSISFKDNKISEITISALNGEYNYLLVFGLGEYYHE